MHPKTRRPAPARRAVKVTGGLVAAAAFLSPRVEVQPADAPAAAGFRVPTLTASAHATMHVSTIANLTTVLRFKAEIMTKTPAQISAFVHTLFHEAAAARASNDPQRLLRSTKRLMVLAEALRDRIEATSRAPK
jgi:hypothetical protein